MISGFYSYIWDGKNNNDEEAARGVYIYRV